MTNSSRITVGQPTGHGGVSTVSIMVDGHVLVGLCGYTTTHGKTKHQSDIARFVAALEALPQGEFEQLAFWLQRKYECSADFTRADEFRLAFLEVDRIRDRLLKTAGIKDS